MHEQSDHRNTTLLAAIALATLLVHVLLGDRYGFHRDELATLDDARHLAWGYVAYPPVTPFFARISLELFGTSLAGFRFFAALADAAAVFPVRTGWTIRSALPHTRTALVQNSSEIRLPRVRSLRPPGGRNVVSGLIPSWLNSV